jgi:hypothetical protein
VDEHLAEAVGDLVQPQAGEQAWRRERGRVAFGQPAEHAARPGFGLPPRAGVVGQVGHQLQIGRSQANPLEVQQRDDAPVPPEHVGGVRVAVHAADASAGCYGGLPRRDWGAQRVQVGHPAEAGLGIIDERRVNTWHGAHPLGQQQGPLDGQGIEIGADECLRRGIPGRAGSGQHGGDLRRKRVGMQHRQRLPDLVDGAAPVRGRHPRPGRGQRHAIDGPGDLPRQLVITPSINDLRIGNARWQSRGDGSLPGEPVAVAPPADTQHNRTDPPDVVGVAGYRNRSLRGNPGTAQHASEPGLAGGGRSLLHVHRPILPWRPEATDKSDLPEQAGQLCMSAAWPRCCRRRDSRRLLTAPRLLSSMGCA